MGVSVWQRPWWPLALLGGFVALLLVLAYAEHESPASEGHSPHRAGLLRALSWALGWAYFVAWSVSFYPQLLLNHRRQSTEGLSYDFVWLNLLGFSCYSVFNAALFASPGVRASYRAAHGGEDSLVRANDVFFALHAAIVTAATLGQMYLCGYRRSPGALVWPPVRWFVVLAVLSSLLYLAAVLVNGNPMWSADPGADNTWTMLSFLYYVSYIKLVVSFGKYCPQVYLNYKRKSTKGWSMVNVVLDMTGGLLSFAQLFIDASLESDWSGLTGDPVKLGLSLLSLAFDAVFLVQHFVFYPPKEDQSTDGGFAETGAADADADADEDELEPLAPV